MVSEVLPCYVLCDVSFSMADHLDEVNAGLREFRGAVHADRTAVAEVRVCVVAFARQPRVVQPLRPAIDGVEVVHARQESGTDFGAAFTLMRTRIDRDVKVLKAQRIRVRRPVLFFISDGRATDTVWEIALSGLTTSDNCPEMIVFGVGAVDVPALDRIGVTRVFLARDGVRLGIALAASVLRPEHH
ncbi:VWA domain-containing protein [Nocardia sp. NRRL S-836]|uniref:vWA domain-containing protein n=1 Tax=Nocardia sp. NRRL S-836 TaxID=1519492 RepID=UPI0006AE13F3|nr:VWA domain-containing protein [Nocardia sp. NRRL S-836]KOV84493.1 hypothetical protein ADL03_16540 [Nocardia sp. NRRL S-836]